jgi:hypothetical protein
MTTRAVGAGRAKSLSTQEGGRPIEHGDAPDRGSADKPTRLTTTGKPTRLSVNISRATVEALQEVSEGKEVSMTEAVRRLVGYGIVVYRAIRDGGEVLIRRDDKTERLVLLD